MALRSFFECDASHPMTKKLKNRYFLAHQDFLSSFFGPPHDYYPDFGTLMKKVGHP
jgi:hypothetical protein